jgi:outer membrane protein assembly factor BamB
MIRNQRFGSQAPQLTAIAAFAIAAATSACTPGKDTGREGVVAPAPATASVAAAPGLLPTWKRDDLTAVSRPVAVGGRAVLYTAADGQLRLTAIDPRDGKTVWSVPATDSSITPGVELHVESHNDDVFYLAPAGRRQFAVLTALDAKTGHRLWSTGRPYRYHDLPSDCDDSASGMCASVTTATGGALHLRVSYSKGTVIPRRVPGGGMRALGGGLYDTLRRNPELINRVSASGDVRWTKTAAQFFGVSNASSDFGWDVDEIEGTVVGTLGRRDSPQDNSVYRDLARLVVTAGIDPASGRRLWSDPGASYRCLGALDGALPDTTGIPFRCRKTGHVTFRDDGRPAITGEDLHVVVEGFDPHTGRTTWHADIGDAPGLAYGIPGPVSVGRTSAVLFVAGHYLRLDVATGDLAEVPVHTAGWCFKPARSVFVRGNESPTQTRVVADHATPCHVDGSALPVPSALDGRHGAVGATKEEF